MNGKPQRYSREESIRIMNKLGQEGQGFLFLISFSGEGNILLPQDQASAQGFHIHMPGRPFSGRIPSALPSLSFRREPIPRERYREAFYKIQEDILYGNSFLLNLTFPTRIQCNYNFGDIFRLARAPFKLYLEDELVVFSPERFVHIQGREIRSNPMKGTMDASLPGAHARLLSDEKEDAEHNTIVDLIRNDLSTVASRVRVKRFKYIEEVNTHRGKLLQMSSEIIGELPEDYPEHLGDLLFSLLPAGSICGAPKRKTLEIIENTEGYARGFFTGIFGYWDGKSLDSAVAIRYMERDSEGLVFKSGGGITALSECEKEYDEMIHKVYVPIY